VFNSVTLLPGGSMKLLILILTLSSSFTFAGETKCSNENFTTTQHLLSQMLLHSSKQEAKLLSLIVDKKNQNQKVSTLKKQLSVSEFRDLRENSSKASSDYVKFATLHPECAPPELKELTQI
jgi:hypothetical protein